MSKKAHLNTWLAAWLFLIAVGVSARASGQTITPSPYWKNRIEFPDDSFRYDQEGVYPPLPGWIKFTILLSDPTTVYFQDSPEYMFHYDFASELLDPFVSMSPAEYDHVTLYEQGQQAVLGAVIMPPIQYGALPTQEYGIQFVRKDPYPREMIRDMFNAVETGIFIFTDSGVEAFYFPTYEQLTTADANRDWFESEGIPVSSSARWAEGNACYSEGWALGDLKFFAGDQIEVAHQSGDLLPGDILLTDGVPAEVPFVAGIITLSPATPNSHVAILSNTYGVPFVHLAIAEDAERAQQLVGHRIAFRTYKEYEGADVRLIDTENVLTDQQVEEILVLKEPPELDIQPVAHYGAYSTSTDGLLLSDIQYFGGKAANFGMLRAAIPDNSPVAIGAITALSKTAGAKNLIEPVAGGAQPLVEALGYPDRHVRFLAAVSLANALPTKRFVGDELVVTQLIEALRQTGRQTALVIIQDERQRNAVKGAMRDLGYDIIDNANLDEAIRAARQSAGVDVAILSAKPDPSATVARFRTDPVFATLPAIIVSDTERVTTLVKRDDSSVQLKVAEGELVTKDVMEASLAEAMKLTAGAEMTGDTAATWTVRAAAAIEHLGTTSNAIYDIKRARGALAAALGDSRRPVRLAASRALSVIQTPEAQRAIAALALDTDAPEDVRVAAFNDLSASLRRFGMHLTEELSQAVLGVVKGKDTSDLLNAAAQALGAMDLPSQEIKSLILTTSN